MSVQPAQAQADCLHACRVNLGPASSGGLPSPEASSLGSRTPSGMKEMVGSGSLDTLAQTIGPKDQAKVLARLAPCPVRPSSCFPAGCYAGTCSRVSVL